MERCDDRHTQRHYCAITRPAHMRVPSTAYTRASGNAYSMRKRCSYPLLEKLEKCATSLSWQYNVPTTLHLPPPMYISCLALCSTQLDAILVRPQCFSPASSTQYLQPATAVPCFYARVSALDGCTTEVSSAPGGVGCVNRRHRRGRGLIGTLGMRYSDIEVYSQDDQTKVMTQNMPRLLARMNLDLTRGMRLRSTSSCSPRVHVRPPGHLTCISPSPPARTVHTPPTGRFLTVTLLLPFSLGFRPPSLIVPPTVAHLPLPRLRLPFGHSVVPTY
ncbi:hypothetical protein R3P38DRAFT_1235027 [Favolaschia claudopus]|uniref:Uncharacterized protein n=1 Tax=Favolaschia claudopus TaxID=2862362 RepID=A0AAW0B2N3_9AGAR